MSATTPSRRAAPAFVYLASQSPRRSDLLRQIGVAHRLLLPRADEDAEVLEAERAGELPVAYVQRVTRAKLRAAEARLLASGLEPAPILCADTTVALGRRIFGKPVDAADARRMLTALSGRTHRAITAVAVAPVVVADVGGGVGVRTAAAGAAPAGPPRLHRRPWLAVSTSHVRFASLTASEIERYVASGEPFGKAGAYAIQGIAGAWIARVAGSYTGIMGLPLHETATLLWRAGLEWSSAPPLPAGGG